VAEERAAGLSRRHMDGPLWAAPTRGVRISRELLEADECQRIYSMARALPADAAISGWAAAYVMGVRWYDSARRILVIRALDMARVRRPGVTTRRTNLDEGETITIHDVRVTSPQRTARVAADTTTSRRSRRSRRHAACRPRDNRRAGNCRRCSPALAERTVRAASAPTPRCCGGITDGVPPAADLGARWASTSAGQRAALRHPHRCIARSTGSSGRGGGRRCRVRRAHITAIPCSIAPTMLASTGWRKRA
jgi:hypothetical protein